MDTVDPAHGINEASAKKEPLASKKRPRRLFILATILFSTFLSLFLLEFALRIFNPLGVKERASWHFLLWAGLRKSANPEKVWETVPNYNQQLVGYGVGLNSLGLRGEEINPEKPTDTFRILAVGDSMTFGMSADQNVSYPAQLHFLLRNRQFERFQSERRNEPLLGPSRPENRVEVLNAGVPGYTTLQEEALLHELLPRLRPDLVVVWWFHNDVILSGRLNPASQDEQLRIQIGIRPHTFSRKLLHAGYEIIPCSFALIRAATIGHRGADGVDFKADPDSQPEGFAANLASLKRMIDYCKSNSTAIIIYTYGTYDAIDRLCTEAGVTHVTTVSRPGREHEDEFAISKYDGHFDRAGNYAVAQSILPHAESLLKGTRPRGDDPSEKAEH